MQHGKTNVYKPHHMLPQFPYALSLVWQSGPGWLCANGFLLLVQGTLPLLSLYLTKRIIDAVTAALALPVPSDGLGDVFLFIFFLGGVSLAGILISSGSRIVSEILAESVRDHIYEIIHRHTQAADLEYFENSEYHNLYHRVIREAPHRPLSIVNGFFRFAVSAVTFLALAGLLVTVHKLLAACLAAVVLPGMYFRFRFADQMNRWREKRSENERLAHYYHWMLTGDAHAKEIRMLGTGPLFRKRFSRLRGRLRREHLLFGLRRSGIEAAYQGGSLLVLVGAVLYIAKRTVLGFITLGDLVMYYQALLRCGMLLRELLNALAGLYENSLFLKYFQEFRELKPKIRRPEHPVSFPHPLRQGITFDHVSFTYPGTRRKVFNDLTLTVRPGERIALVGENGAGKTTLVKLLCRFYDPDSGSITMDGTDIRRFDPADLRREIGIIFQDFNQYHFSAGENIRLGDTALSSHDPKIRQAAEYAGADKLIRKLPQGYDTLLGRWFESGEALSAGQWQRIALARAIAGRASLLIFDEPTSLFDPKAQHKLIQRIRKITEDRTAVFISHRLSVARMADRILVLKDGGIVEAGAHEALMEQNGRYAALFRLQAAKYV